MKIILFASFLVLIDAPPQKNSLVAAIDKSNFVGFLYHDRLATNDDPVFKAVEVFKGNIYMVIDRNGEIPINNDDLYLVVGNTYDYFLSNVNYPVSAVKKLPQAALDVLQTLPCYDEAVKREYENMVCTRQYEPICGCDNKAYGSICEMHKRGIIRFRAGDCR